MNGFVRGPWGSEVWEEASSRFEGWLVGEGLG